jgi:SAM-dependent methyltransferase
MNEIALQRPIDSVPEAHPEPCPEPCPDAVEPSDCPNFDRLAALYRWMELATFGPWLQWCRCAWLDRLICCRHALVLGDGDGRFTARLLRANPALTLDAVDASPAMLKALVRRAGPFAGRVTLHSADARLWLPAGQPYDLVVTHFFLDCLTTEEVRMLAKAVRASVDDRALWVVSEFAIPRNRFGRFVARPLVAGLYRAFGWLTGLAVRSLPEYANALGQAGFTLKGRRTWLGGLLTSEVWSPNGRSEP